MFFLKLVFAWFFYAQAAPLVFMLAGVTQSAEQLAFFPVIKIAVIFMLWQGLSIDRRLAGIVWPENPRWLWLPPLVPIALQALAAGLPIAWRCVALHDRFSWIGLTEPAAVLAPLAATAILLDPVYEEVMFRGILQPLARCQWRPWPAIIFCALLFGFSHAPIGGLWQVLAGFAFGWVRERSGSLAPAILLHMTINALIIYGGVSVVWK